MQRCVAVLSVFLFLSSCSGQPPVPVPPSASPLPSIAPSEPPQPSSQVTPSPSVSPSLQPTVIPFPTPSATPFPTPTPTLSSYPVEVVAGSGKQGFEDGPALQASFNSPQKACFDARDGSMYIPDTHMLRKLTPDGQVITVAGGKEPGYRDGPAQQAQFNLLIACVVDSEGQVLISDVHNRRIRKYSPRTGLVSTFLGSGADKIQDGDLQTASLEYPQDLLLHSSGALYLTDSFRLRKFTEGKLVTLNAAQTGAANRQFVRNGPLQSSENLFGRFLWLAMDAREQFYLADYDLRCVRMVDFQGQVRNFSPNYLQAIEKGLDLNFQWFSLPRGIAFDVQRNTFFIGGDNLIFAADLEGNMQPILGEISATETSVSFQMSEGGLVMGPDHNLYIMGNITHRIERVRLPNPNSAQNP